MCLFIVSLENPIPTEAKSIASNAKCLAGDVFYFVFTNIFSVTHAAQRRVMAVLMQMLNIYISSTRLHLLYKPSRYRADCQQQMLQLFFACVCVFIALVFPLCFTFFSLSAQRWKAPNLSQVKSPLCTHLPQARRKAAWRGAKRARIWMTQRRRETCWRMKMRWVEGKVRMSAALKHYTQAVYMSASSTVHNIKRFRDWGNISALTRPIISVGYLWSLSPQA